MPSLGQCPYLGTAQVLAQQFSFTFNAFEVINLVMELHWISRRPFGFARGGATLMMNLGIAESDFTVPTNSIEVLMKSVNRRVLKPVLYDRLRIQLEQEEKDLHKQLEAARKQLLHIAPSSSESSANPEPDQEALIERTRRCRQKLNLVVHGLRRIREGAFGLCELCEEPIGHKRLQALPTARYCINCQEQEERVG
jgi:DnaK suppressor protein